MVTVLLLSPLAKLTVPEGRLPPKSLASAEFDQAFSSVS